MKSSQHVLSMRSNDVFLIIVLTLIAAGISILSISLLWSRNESLHQQMSQMQQSLNRISEQSAQEWRGTRPTAQVADEGITYGEIVQRFEVSKQSKTYRLTQFCQGAIQAGFPDGGSIPFCLGKNQLVFSDGITNTLLQSMIATSSELAPILKKPTLLGGNAVKTRLLLSYSPDLCNTTNNCGVGMPEWVVTHLYTVEDGALRTLSAFPTSGEYYWNADQTKVIVVPRGCGGAGCGLVALLGYDLTKDQVKEVTKAEGAETELAFDVVGKRLSYWKNIAWTTNDVATATVVSADGKSAKTVRMSF